MKQLKRGHNTVADRWAVRSPQRPPPTPACIKTIMFFPLLDSLITDRWTEGLMDRPTGGWIKPLLELYVRN